MPEKNFADMTLEEMDQALLDNQARIDKAIEVQHKMKQFRDVKHGEAEAEKVPAHVQAAIINKHQSIASAGSIAPKSAVGTPGK